MRETTHNDPDDRIGLKRGREGHFCVAFAIIALIKRQKILNFPPKSSFVSEDCHVKWKIVNEFLKCNDKFDIDFDEMKS